MGKTKERVKRLLTAYQKDYEDKKAKRILTYGEIVLYDKIIKDLENILIWDSLKREKD